MSEESITQDEISSEVFSENSGAVGETFGMLTPCDSCDKRKIHGVDIVGDTVLGDLLGLGGVEVDIEMGGTATVPERQTICDECFQHLLQAKKDTVEEYE
jgi:hypothetical protein